MGVLSPRSLVNPAVYARAGWHWPHSSRPAAPPQLCLGCKASFPGPTPLRPCPGGTSRQSPPRRAFSRLLAASGPAAIALAHPTGRKAGEKTANTANRANTANGAFGPPPPIVPNSLRMTAKQPAAMKTQRAVFKSLQARVPSAGSRAPSVEDRVSDVEGTKSPPRPSPPRPSPLAARHSALAPWTSDRL
jgi:hypothetical protein